MATGRGAHITPQVWLCEDIRRTEAARAETAGETEARTTEEHSRQHSQKGKLTRTFQVGEIKGRTQSTKED